MSDLPAGVNNEPLTGNLDPPHSSQMEKVEYGLYRMVSCASEQA